MATSQLWLSELKSYRCGQTVVTSVLRFWEARDVKKDCELMGIDILLLDDKTCRTPSQEIGNWCPPAGSDDSDQH
ncbi:hypothetical protein Bca101_081514 [Brassica carinata]